MKVSRLIKRRTVANDACDAARITANGKPAKASYQVKIGDVIEITFGNRPVKVRVLSIDEPRARMLPASCLRSWKAEKNQGGGVLTARCAAYGIG
mgnify:CR=1 FL=1